MRAAATVAALCAAATRAQQAPDPRDVAKRAMGQFMKQPTSGDFWKYQYGSSIMMAAAYEASARFPGQNYTRALDRQLAFYMTNSSAPAFKILNNISMAFDSAVGDHVGLFPIAYLARLDYYGLPVGPETPEWTIAVRTAQQYIDVWPYHLPDGTYSRMGGWPGEPTGQPTFVWADDALMGLGLLAALIKHGYANASAYADALAGIQVNYEAHLRDAATGVYRHGYDAATGAQSCCAWGRANGWQMMSHVDALNAIPADHPRFNASLAVFQRHAAAMAALQNASDGRWHQVLDAPETFLETSVTAMTLYGLAIGACARARVRARECGQRGRRGRRRCGDVGAREQRVSGWASVPEEKRAGLCRRPPSLLK